MNQQISVSGNVVFSILSLFSGSVPNAHGDVPLASAAVRKRVQELRNPGQAGEEANTTPADTPLADDESGRKPIEGDCPICYEEMSSSEEIAWCRAGCGNNVHMQCFRMWLGRGKDTCVLCRTKWKKSPQEEEQEAVARSSGIASTCTNLASLEPGTSATSTYHPRPGPHGIEGGVIARERSEGIVS